MGTSYRIQFWKKIEKLKAKMKRALDDYNNKK